MTCLAYLLIRATAAEPVGNLVAAAAGVAMSIVGACLMRGSRCRVWVALAAGQVMYLAGDVLWVIYESVLHISPYPSVADAFYLSRYALLTLGLMSLIRRRRQGRDQHASGADLVAVGAWSHRAAPTATRAQDLFGLTPLKVAAGRVPAGAQRVDQCAIGDRQSAHGEAGRAQRHDSRGFEVVDDCRQVRDQQLTMRVPGQLRGVPKEDD